MQPGIYKHFKGSLYEVLGVALSSEDPTQEFVVYRALYAGDFPEGQLWIRPKEMFLEMVEINGQKIPRFERQD